MTKNKISAIITVLYNAVIRRYTLSESEATTLCSILSAGKKEFLEKGFSAASLRNIAKEANVTTGAFYGYFKSKEALFERLVGESAKICMDRYKRAQTVFADLPAEQQPMEMGKISGDCMDNMVDFMYEHFDDFKLILCCSKGTKYENFIHEMVEIEVEATYRFMNVLRNLGRRVNNIDPALVHILASGMFTAYFEMIIHDMPKKQAIGYVKELREFYTAGWKSVMDFE